MFPWIGIALPIDVAGDINGTISAAEPVEGAAQDDDPLGEDDAPDADIDRLEGVDTAGVGWILVKNIADVGGFEEILERLRCTLGVDAQKSPAHNSAKQKKPP